MGCNFKYVGSIFQDQDQLFMITIWGSGSFHFQRPLRNSIAFARIFLIRLTFSFFFFALFRFLTSDRRRPPFSEINPTFYKSSDTLSKSRRTFYSHFIKAQAQAQTTLAIDDQPQPQNHDTPSKNLKHSHPLFNNSTTPSIIEYISFKKATELF